MVGPRSGVWLFLGQQRFCSAPKLAQACATVNDPAITSGGLPLAKSVGQRSGRSPLLEVWHRYGVRMGASYSFAMGRPCCRFPVTPMDPSHRGTPRCCSKGSTYSGAGGFGNNYDLAPDGQRFIMIKTATEETSRIHVLLNWFEELKERVPVP